VEIYDILLLLFFINKTGCILREVGAETEETVDYRKMTVEKARWQILPFTLSQLYRAIRYELP
jgi:hypothetical protein